MLKATSGLYGNSEYWLVIKGRERLFVFCPQSFVFFFQRKKDSGKACIKTQDENIREAHSDELKEAPVVCPQLG